MPRYFLALLVAFLIAAPAFAVEPFPSSFHTQEIKTNGTTLYVRIGGQGPAVVMLHGFADTGDMWAPAATVLVKNHTVVVPDLRGMGLSAHPDMGYTKTNQAVDIAGVMDALKIEQADLVTHDIGNKAPCFGISTSAGRTKKGWLPVASVSISIAFIMSSPPIRRKSTRRPASTMPHFTRGLMPCTTPSSSSARSTREPSITRRYSQKAASWRCRY